MYTYVRTYDAYVAGRPGKSKPCTYYSYNLDELLIITDDESIPVHSLSLLTRALSLFHTTTNSSSYRQKGCQQAAQSLRPLLSRVVVRPATKGRDKRLGALQKISGRRGQAICRGSRRARDKRLARKPCFPPVCCNQLLNGLISSPSMYKPVASSSIGLTRLCKTRVSHFFVLQEYSLSIRLGPYMYRLFEVECGLIYCFRVTSLLHAQGFVGTCT
jgi:hypothetical protein